MTGNKIDTDRRQTILKAARTIFLRHGYTESKMSDIAKKAKVAPGTLYLYFPSKESLANSIGEEVFARLLREFSDTVVNLEKPSDIDDLVRWATNVGDEERQLLVLLKLAGEGEVHGSYKREFRNRLADLLTETMKKEHVRSYPAMHLADIVISILGGIFKACILSDKNDVEVTRDASAKLLKHAIFEDSAL
jgi:AcrR family transcriptional regulator